MMCAFSVMVILLGGCANLIKTGGETPAGTYMIMVTGSTADGAQTAAVTLTVQ
jgi:hypothetical protein